MISRRDRQETDPGQGKSPEKGKLALCRSRSYQSAHHSATRQEACAVPETRRHHQVHGRCRGWKIRQDREDQKEAWKVDRQGRTWHGLQNRWTSRRHLTYAVSQGLIDKNPVHGVRKPADKVRKRRLNDDEYHLLGQILREKGEDEQFKSAVQIARHLTLTACRRSEEIYLKRPEIDVDGSCLRLEDSKEGASVRPIGLSAIDHLTPLLADDDEGFVFGDSGG